MAMWNSYRFYWRICDVSQGLDINRYTINIINISFYFWLHTPGFDSKRPSGGMYTKYK
jgi:hypothetical protein